MTIGLQSTISCKTLLLLVVGSVLATSGCKSGGGQTAPAQSTATSASAATSAVVPSSSAPNQVPTISGSPGVSVAAGQTYTFVPVAADSDGDSLGFSIENLPAWATFETPTGRLTGTPAASNAGTFADIRISVSDGQASTALPAFSLTVTAGAIAATTGTATLSWEAPTENTDGSALTGLAGYRIRYGTSADTLTQEISINTTGTTTYMITDLAPATYYFAIKAFTSDGAESALSDVASKTVT